MAAHFRREPKVYGRSASARPGCVACRATPPRRVHPATSPPRRRCPRPCLRSAPPHPARAPLRRQAPPPGAAGYRAVFAVREFRAVFAAHLLSLLGVVVSELALTVLVYDLTGSPLLSALTFALGFLPYVIGGTLLAGVADRYPARRILVACDLICAGCVAVMVLPGTPVARAPRASLRGGRGRRPSSPGRARRPSPTSSGTGDLFVLGRSLLRIVSQSALLIGFGARRAAAHRAVPARRDHGHRGDVPLLGGAAPARHPGPARPRGGGRRRPAQGVARRGPRRPRRPPDPGAAPALLGAGRSSWSRRRRSRRRTRTRSAPAPRPSGC